MALTLFYIRTLLFGFTLKLTCLSHGLDQPGRIDVKYGQGFAQETNNKKIKQQDGINTMKQNGNTFTGSIVADFVNNHAMSNTINFENDHYIETVKSKESNGSKYLNDKKNRHLWFTGIHRAIKNQSSRKPRDTTRDANDKTKQQLFPCYEEGRCSNNYQAYPPNCYCDDICTIYNDCCHDADDSSKSRSRLLFEKTQYLNNFSDCMSIPSALRHLDGNYRGFYMVTRCPSTKYIDQTDVNKCSHNNHTKFPIPVTDDDGITYLNLFCARCHGVTNFTYWELGFHFDHCTEFDLILLRESFIRNVVQRMRILYNAGCSLLYIPPSQFTKEVTTSPRTCVYHHRKYVKNQPSKKCDSYSNLVAVDTNLTNYMSIAEKLFITRERFLARNYNCIKKIHRDKTFNCIQPKTISTTDFYWQHPGIIFKTAKYQFRPHEENQRCSEHNDNSIIKMDDIDVCVTETVRDVHIKVDIVLESINTPPVSFFERAMSNLYMEADLSQYKLYNKDEQSNKANIVCGENSFYLISESCCTCTMTLSLVITREITPKLVQILRRILEMRPFEYEEAYEGTPVLQFTATKHTVYNIASSSCQIPVSSPKILKQFKFDTQLINISTAANKIDKEELYKRTVKEIRQMAVSLAIIGQMSVLPKQTNNRIPQELTSTAPEPQNNKESHVSIPMSSFSGNPDDCISIYTFVKYFVMVLSTLVLGLTIVLLIYFSYCQSLLGQICMNIMLILFCSNVVYMFGIEATANKIVCSSIGAILHYTWVSMFIWVFLYTLLAYQIMSKFKNGQPLLPDIYFSKQSIYFMGYGFPFVITTPCVAMEILEDSTLKIGYSDELCFLSVYPANTIFLSGPIIFCTGVCSVVLFISSRPAKKLYLKNMNSTSRVYLEYMNNFGAFCFVSFLLWVFVVMMQVFKDVIPGYCFTIVIGSHGLVFSVCILSSKQARTRLCVRSNRPFKSGFSPEYANGPSENLPPESIDGNSKICPNVGECPNKVPEVIVGIIDHQCTELVKEHFEKLPKSANEFSATRSAIVCPGVCSEITDICTNSKSNSAIRRTETGPNFVS